MLKKASSGINSTKGLQKYPYRLPEWKDAETVFVVEGEKDADLLLSLGIDATCNPGGAGKWPDTFTDYFKNKHVVILPDNDRPGKDHAGQVARNLHGFAASVKILTLSDKPKGDVSDWAEAGHTKEELLNKVKDAPEWKPSDRRASTSPENGKQGGRKKISYANIANAFAESRRDERGRLTVRYHQGQWWEFSESCYIPMQQDDIKAEVMAFLRDNFPKNESRNTRDNVIANLQAFDLCALPSRLRVPTWVQGRNYQDATGWLAMSNTVVNIPNLAHHYRGEKLTDAEVFCDPTPELFSTFGLTYAFKAKAACPKWLAYLAGVQPNEEDRRVLQMLAGLALIPDTSWNVAFFLSGDGGTGKSVFLYVLTHLVGAQNVCCLPLPKFDDRFSSWMLSTHLLNIVGDLPTEDGQGHNLRQVEGMFKDVCDGNLVPVEHKHQEPGKAPAIARNLFATNSLPRFADRSDALWDRIRVLPFDERFRGTTNEDRNLRYDIVRKELPGVFLWAVQGLAYLQAERRFPEHSKGLKKKEDHRTACDPERVFLIEHYEKGGVNDYVQTKDCYQTFRDWCDANGYNRRTEHTFQEAVKRTFSVHKTRARIAGSQLTIYPRIRKKN